MVEEEEVIWVGGEVVGRGYIDKIVVGNSVRNCGDDCVQNRVWVIGKAEVEHVDKTGWLVDGLR